MSTLYFPLTDPQKQEDGNSLEMDQEPGSAPQRKKRTRISKFNFSSCKQSWQRFCYLLEDVDEGVEGWPLCPGETRRIRTDVNCINLCEWVCHGCVRGVSWVELTNSDDYLICAWHRYAIRRELWDVDFCQVIPPMWSPIAAIRLE